MEVREGIGGINGGGGKIKEKISIVYILHLYFISSFLSQIISHQAFINTSYQDLFCMDIMYFTLLNPTVNSQSSSY